MKKFFALLSAVLLLLSLVGCSWSGRPKDNGGVLQVGVIVEDNTAGKTVRQALEQLSESRPGIHSVFGVVGQDGIFAELVSSFAQQGCTLVVVVGGVEPELVAQTALAMPQLQFAVDCDQDFGLPNVCSMTFDLLPAVYLAGYAAGKTTETDRIGCTYGRMTPQTDAVLAAFLAGVRAGNKEAQVLRSNTHLRGDTRTAEEMIANGVDVIFHADEQGRAAVVAACIKHKIGAACVDTGAEPAGAVLVSAERDPAYAVTDLVCLTALGDFPAGLRQYDISGGVCLALQAEKLPQNLPTSIETVKNRLAAGEIAIPATLAELEKTVE